MPKGRNTMDFMVSFLQPNMPGKSKYRIQAYSKSDALKRAKARWPSSGEFEVLYGVKMVRGKSVKF
ncbi:hypothetical protein GQ473_06125 [archaeon]|nr:hypothetical protein [archaeon]